ncbi:hypothetical protein H8B02_45235 [Bradyrhizobium sp. Pear77]|nr:hypothetical protein [Bradyrhizobium altum]
MGLGALRLCDSYAIERALPSKTYSRARIVAPRLTSLDGRRGIGARGVGSMRRERATESQGKLLCAWQLAMLRFAVTRDDADRMRVLAMAGELDRSGGSADGTFHFFRRTSAELCHAITGSDAHAEAIVRRFEAQIENPRLRRAFEAAIGMDRPPPKIVASRTRPRADLWRGLAPRHASAT